MDNTNTNINAAPATPMPEPPPVAEPMPTMPPTPTGNSGSNPTKIILVVLILAVVVASAVGAVLMYQKMKADAMKAPATNYVVEDANKVTPTSAEPTVPPVLSQPVAQDASGIDNEIKILEETASGTDSTTIKTQDIQDISK